MSSEELDMSVDAICARHVAQVTGHPNLTQLIRHADKFGTDCVRESGDHLSDEQQKVLNNTCLRIERETKKRRFA